MASSLSVEQNKSEPGKLVIRMGEADVTKSLSGGTLSGLIRANNEVIDGALKTIGTLALGLTEQMNRQQGLGLDLDGQPGSPLFAAINDPQLQSMRAIEAASNSSTSTGSIAVSITDTSALTGDDYVLDFVGPNNNDYALSRASTGEIVTKGSFNNAPSTISLSEGVDITLTEGQYTPGDRVLIQPSRGGAEVFRVSMKRPEELAFAQGIRTDTALGNNGTGGVTAGEVIASADDVPNLLTKMKQPLIIRFTSDTTYEVLDNSDPANPQPLVPAIDNRTFVVGKSNQVFSNDPNDPTYRGYQVNLTGVPKSGDEFTIGFNSDGVGDNRNVLSMIDLQEKATLGDGTKTFSQSYNDLLQGIGGLTNQSKIDRDAAEAVLEQSRTARDAEAGVNLDEEAARLIQLEQNYNASARIITTARQIFDSLLQAVS
jgi:flagellar hook-associated protein 1 FlgK